MPTLRMSGTYRSMIPSPTSTGGPIVYRRMDKVSRMVAGAVIIITSAGIFVRYRCASAAIWFTSFPTSLLEVPAALDRGEMVYVPVYTSRMVMLRRPTPTSFKKRC